MIDSYGANGDKKAWLGVDPGITTGWCLIDEHWKVVGTGNIPPIAVADSLDTIIRGAHRQGYALSGVIERVPNVGGNSPLSVELDDVIRQVYNVLVEVYDLPTTMPLPGEWKTSRIAKTIKPSTLWDGKLTQHQKDAILMTIYAIDKAARRIGR